MLASDTLTEIIQAFINVRRNPKRAIDRLARNLTEVQVRPGPKPNFDTIQILTPAYDMFLFTAGLGLISYFGIIHAVALAAPFLTDASCLVFPERSAQFPLQDLAGTGKWQRR